MVVKSILWREMPFQLQVVLYGHVGKHPHNGANPLSWWDFRVMDALMQQWYDARVVERFCTERRYETRLVDFYNLEKYTEFNLRWM